MKSPRRSPLWHASGQGRALPVQDPGLGPGHFLIGPEAQHPIHAHDLFRLEAAPGVGDGRSDAPAQEQREDRPDQQEVVGGGILLWPGPWDFRTHPQSDRHPIPHPDVEGGPGSHRHVFYTPGWQLADQQHLGRPLVPLSRFLRGAAESFKALLL